MGEVWRARAADGRAVAVKLLRSRLDSEDAIRRFRREALVRIDHPNVIQVLDAGVDAEGTSYIAFELLEGESLEACIARGALAPARAVQIAVAACDGLAAAHAAGIVHRDLKPANLFVTRDGHVKVLDFGIARVSSADTQLTMAGSVIGTPSYLAPEQARGEHEVDGRADVWALGVVLYEMVTGTRPFERASPLASMLAVLMEDPPRLSSLLLAPQHELDAVVTRCLAKSRDARWATIGELGRALAGAKLSRAAPVTTSTALSTIETLIAPRSSIVPGEQRVVALMLAEGITDGRAVETAVAMRGGTHVALAGERAVGVFGGEAWEGDEAAQAVGAAWAARVGAARVAVALGRAASIGGAISGAAIESAERGCALRKEGVVVDASIAALVRDQFELAPEREGMQHVAGPHRASLGPVRGEPSGEAPIVGRDAELAQIRAAVEMAFVDARPNLVLVSGPPGIGKSRLRRELRGIFEAWEPALRVFVARAEPLAKETALSLLRNAIARKARDRRASGSGDARETERRRALEAMVREAFADRLPASDVAAFLGELVGVTMPDTASLAAAKQDPELMSDRLRLAVVDYLEALSARGPLAIVLEDLQWADRPSLDVIERLLARVATGQLFVFVTARPELAESRPDLFASHEVTRIALRGLLPSHAARLLRAVAGGPVAKALEERVVERTGGNPLFLEQIVGELRDSSALGSDPAALPIPLSVEAAVQSRLDHLPPPEKEACKRAAVLGRPFSIAELEALGVPAPRTVLPSLARRDLVVVATTKDPDERSHRFRSPLVGEVAYRMIAAPVLVDLHRRAATHLASRADSDPFEIAYHFELAGERGAAATHYSAAALSASRRGDAATTARAGERAFGLGGPQESERFELHMAMSDALRFLGRRADQSAHLEKALAIASTDLERARASTDRAAWLFRSGRNAEAGEEAARAVEHARRSADPGTIAAALTRRVTVIAYAGDVAAARTLLDEAAAVAVTAPVSVRAGVAECRALVASLAGDLGERQDAFSEALVLRNQAGDLRRSAGTEANLADGLNRFGAYAEAEQALRDALDKCRRVGNKLVEGYGLVNLAYALSKLQRHDEAVAALAEAEALARAVNDSRLSLWVTLYRSRVALEAGDAELASGLAGDAATRAKEMGLTATRAVALVVGASSDLRAGRAARALEQTKEALALRDELGGLEEDEAELFLAHASALEASGHGQEASAAREAGAARLEEVAMRIRNADWRRRFLADVAAHRTLAPNARA